MFLVLFDKHTSMGRVSSAQQQQQHSHGKHTALDMTKAATEALISVYCKHQLSSPIVLLETGDKKTCMVTQPSDPIQKFEEHVKNFQVEAVEQSTHFGFSVSLAFSIFNKYRVKNGTDVFGHGRCPWVLEPGSLFIFTNGQSQGPGCEPEFEVENPWPMCEYVHDSHKWDHRVYVFVMSTDGEPPFIPPQLAKLCATTGGEVVVCKTMKDAHSSCKSLASRLISTPPTVSLRLSVLDSFCGNGSTTHLGKILVKCAGEWPIPEQGWVDINGKIPIPPRDAVPLLHIVKGNLPAVTLSRTLLQIARDIDVNPDTYELGLHANAKTLELEKSEFYPVYLNGSWKHAGLNSEDSPLGTQPEPFAILSTGAKTGQYHFTVLPFNYPKFLQLLKQVVDPIKAGKTIQELNAQVWINQWRSEFATYLASVPPYYFPSIGRVLKRLSLRPLALGPQQSSIILEFELHKTHTKRLKRAQNSSLTDIAAMDQVVRDGWQKVPLNPSAIALATSAHSQQSLPVGAVSQCMPKMVSDVHHSELLSVWEKMRVQIFGGGSGVTVRGIHVAGVVGTGGRMSQSDVFDTSGDWLNKATGGSVVPRECTKDMSNFLAVLARQECLRDAVVLDIPEDEDKETGILKRKLSPPNFGNRYGGGSSRKSAKHSMEFEIEGLATVDLRKPQSVSMLEAMANEAVSKVFMDTPSPYTEDTYLEDSLSAATEDDALMNVDAGEEDEPINEPLADVIVSNLRDNAYATIPKLGKPPRRPPRPHNLSFQAASTGGIAAAASTSSQSSAESEDATTFVKNNGSSSSSSSSSSGIKSLGSNQPASPSSSPSSSPTSVTNGISEAGHSPTSAVTVEAAAKPSEWVKHFSQKYNRQYWFHAASGKSVWSDPNV